MPFKPVKVLVVGSALVLTLSGSAEAFPTITEFPVPLASYHNHPEFITAGPDGNLWFTLQLQKIGRMTPTGVVKKFDLPSYAAQGHDITLGSDGALWFTQPGVGEIGRMTTSGALTEFPVPGTPWWLTAGPRGAIWFTEANRILSLSPTGVVHRYPEPTPNAGIGTITEGPDGDLWFTEPDASQIGRLTPRGHFREFPLHSGRDPFAITLGPNGNLWFTEAYRIGEISTSGVLTEFRVGTGTMNDITQGPDARLWFTDYQTQQVGWISTAGAHALQETPSFNTYPLGITAGPDGNVWFVENIGNAIGRVNLH